MFEDFLSLNLLLTVVNVRPEINDWLPEKVKGKVNFD